MTRTRRPLSIVRAILIAAVVTAMLTYFTAWVVGFAMEAEVFSQPREPQGIYTHPRVVKGGLHYVSDIQDFWLGFEEWSIQAAFFAMIVFGGGYEWLKRKDERLLMQRLRDGSKFPVDS